MLQWHRRMLGKKCSSLSAGFLASEQGEDHGALWPRSASQDARHFEHGGRARSIIVSAVINVVPIHRRANSQVIQMCRKQQRAIRTTGSLPRSIPTTFLVELSSLREAPSKFSMAFSGSASRIFVASGLVSRRLKSVHQPGNPLPFEDRGQGRSSLRRSSKLRGALRVDRNDHGHRAFVGQSGGPDALLAAVVSQNQNDGAGVLRVFFIGIDHMQGP